MNAQSCCWRRFRRVAAGEIQTCTCSPVSVLSHMQLQMFSHRKFGVTRRVASSARRSYHFCERSSVLQRQSSDGARTLTNVMFFSLGVFDLRVRLAVGALLPLLRPWVGDGAKSASLAHQASQTRKSNTATVKWPSKQPVLCPASAHRTIIKGKTCGEFPLGTNPNFLPDQELLQATCFPSHTLRRENLISV